MPGLARELTRKKSGCTNKAAIAKKVHKSSMYMYIYIYQINGRQCLDSIAHIYFAYLFWAFVLNRPVREAASSKLFSPVANLLYSCIFPFEPGHVGPTFVDYCKQNPWSQTTYLNVPEWTNYNEPVFFFVGQSKVLLVNGPINPWSHDDRTLGRPSIFRFMWMTSART